MRSKVGLLLLIASGSAQGAMFTFDDPFWAFAATDTKGNKLDWDIAGATLNVDGGTAYLTIRMNYRTPHLTGIGDVVFSDQESPLYILHLGGEDAGHVFMASTGLDLTPGDRYVDVHRTGDGYSSPLYSISAAFPDPFLPGQPYGFYFASDAGRHDVLGGEFEVPATDARLADSLHAVHLTSAVVATPEPAGCMLVAAGLTALMALRRKRR